MRPETVAFIAYVVCMTLPPIMALFMLRISLAGERVDVPALTLCGVMLLAWVPIIIAAPQVTQLLTGLALELMS